MEKTFSRIKIIFGLVVTAIVICISATNLRYVEDTYKEYYCDVKTIELETKIDVYDKNNDKLFARIKGHAITIATDPLIMESEQGEEIGYASDKYCLLSQDRHDIICDNNKIEMVGKVKAMGDEYKIQDAYGKNVAICVFNEDNTHGIIEDYSGKVFAEYDSKHLENDFTIKISKDTILNDKVILMIMASYYSDKKYE